MTVKDVKRNLPGYKGGYVGKILKVNLSTGDIDEEGLPSDEVLRKYMGGWGLGMRYLYDSMPPGYSAADPQNPLVFMTGPLTGLRLPGANNITLVTKNFNTGYTASRSHTHGSFGTLIKAAGYDGLIITGKSDKPVYLWIHDGSAELRDASHLWGQKDSHETADVIKEELGNSKISVAAIGPAGENLCAGSMICNDENHAFSHCGVGAIMGAKNLKAIAVFGNKPIPVVDPERVASMRKEWIRRMQIPGHFGWYQSKNNAIKKKDYRERASWFGFCGKNLLVNELKEFGLGLSQQEWINKPCPRCPLNCSADIRITTGPHKGYLATPGPGGEPMEGAGAILGITEPGTYIYLNDLYDRFGIECSEVGCTMAMAIEAYERGLITKEDTDGLELEWGDGKVAEALLKKIVYREGFGDILARGIKRAAEHIGGDAPDFAVNIKGTGMNLHDWRSAWGTLFSQIVGGGISWPATSVDVHSVEPDIGYPEQTGPFDWAAKPLEAAKAGMIKSMNDSSGLCMLVTWGIQGVFQLTADSINAATGWNVTRDELIEAGQRAMQLERAFNVRHGLEPADDWTVSARLIDPPNDGPAKGMSIKPHLVGMVKEYYRLMGWDEKTGKPSRATLERLGLDDVVKDLWE